MKDPGDCWLNSMHNDVSDSSRGGVLAPDGLEGVGNYQSLVMDAVGAGAPLSPPSPAGQGGGGDAEWGEEEGRRSECTVRIT